MTEQVHLNVAYDKIDDVPEQFRALYTADDDGKVFLSGIDGVKTTGDVDRVKKALQSERQLRAQMERELRALQQSAKEAEENKEASANDAEKLFERKAAPLKRERDEMAKQLEEFKAQIAAFQQRERESKIERVVRDTLAKSQGLRQTAIEDALLLASVSLEIDEDGNVVTKEGRASMPGLSVDAWLREIRQSRRHWWGDDVAPSVSSKSSNYGTGGSNPWSKDSWNLTEQIRIARNDPNLAEQLRKIAK